MTNELKIKPETYYETRDGSKFFVVGVTPDEIERFFPVRGYVKREDGSWEEGCWQKDGRFTFEGNPHPYDLIEEWKEPKLISDIFTENLKLIFYTDFDKTNIFAHLVRDWYKPQVTDVASIPLKDLRKPDGTPIMEGDGINE